MANMIGYIIRIIIWYFILAGHKDDGNIWGIYFNDTSLLIGDFWAALIVIYLTYRIYRDISQMIDDMDKWLK
jgi:hypothetical protein